MFKKCKIGIKFQKFGRTIRITMKQNETNTKKQCKRHDNFFSKTTKCKKRKIHNGNVFCGFFFIRNKKGLHDIKAYTKYVYK